MTEAGAHADDARQLHFKACAVATSTFELSQRHRLTQRSAAHVGAAAAQRAADTAAARPQRYTARQPER